MREYKINESIKEKALETLCLNIGTDESLAKIISYNFICILMSVSCGYRLCVLMNLSENIEGGYWIPTVCYIGAFMFFVWPYFSLFKRKELCEKMKTTSEEKVRITENEITYEQYAGEEKNKNEFHILFDEIESYDYDEETRVLTICGKITSIQGDNEKSKEIKSISLIDAYEISLVETLNENCKNLKHTKKTTKLQS